MDRIDLTYLIFLYASVRMVVWMEVESESDCDGGGKDQQGQSGERKDRTEKRKERKQIES